MVSMMANDEMFKPDENGVRRKVFTNIKGLKIPHTHIETDAKKLPKSTDEQLSAHDMYEWIKKPENVGAIVIVDEAQDVWPHAPQVRKSRKRPMAEHTQASGHRYICIDTRS